MPIDVLSFLQVMAICTLAGVTSFVGALLSKYIRFSEQQLLFLTAFGAGILSSAAIFQMVIESEEIIGNFSTLVSFLGGAVIFTLADIVAERKGGGAGILLGIGLDSIPESLAIGASVATGPGFVLALLIGIQNVPEGIASYKEMTTAKTAFGNPQKALTAIGIVSIIPIILGIIGLFFLQGMHYAIGLILAISAGGIFYMLYYDMVPKAHKERNWLPTFGAVIGFIIGFGIVRVFG
jgi:zinc transporter, ZIP family